MPTDLSKAVTWFKLAAKGNTEYPNGGTSLPAYASFSSAASFFLVVARGELARGEHLEISNRPTKHKHKRNHKHEHRHKENNNKITHTLSLSCSLFRARPRSLSPSEYPKGPTTSPCLFGMERVWFCTSRCRTNWFQGMLVFKARRLLYHSTLGRE